MYNDRHMLMISITHVISLLFVINMSYLNHICINQMKNDPQIANLSSRYFHIPFLHILILVHSASLIISPTLIGPTIEMLLIYAPV